MSDKTGEMRLLDLEFDQVLGFMISITSSKAIQYMGVPLNGKESVKDLEKAKVMIDCTSYIVEQLVPHVSEDEVRGFNSMVSDLKLRYVRET
ncbi:MAG: DUF1844 domain-containing protein [Candidatus Bathyarchaeota archaeon]|nr:DUF1844 domain-containing protein [Candidatus Bathyarchaeota archaeon]